MSERKSINKYYPPGYDPTKEQKKKKTKSTTIPTVRLMLPFSMKCLHCDQYIAHRRKFNARKETTGEDYLGIKIIMFTFRCPKCNAQLSFQTDPKNGDFECIDGCKKNYEKPKPIKTKETVEEMIERLENEALEDAKLKDKGKNKNIITGVEELENRMIQQQKEREMFDEIEMLQDQSEVFRTKKTALENKLNTKEPIYVNDEKEIEAFKDKHKEKNQKSIENQIFKNLIKKEEPKSLLNNVSIKSSPGLSLGYSSSEEESEDDEPQPKKQKLFFYKNH